MDLQKIRNHPLFEPIAWSLVFHAALLILSMSILMQDFAQKREKQTPYFKVRSVELKSTPRRTEIPRQISDRVQFLKGTPTGSVGGVFVKNVPLDAVLGDHSMMEEASKSQISRKPGLRDSPALRSRDIESVVVRTEERQIKEDIPLKGKPTTDLLTRFTGKIISGDNPNAPQVFHTLHRTLGQNGYSAGNVGLDPEEGMPGFTPSGSGGPGDGVGGEGGEDDLSADKVIQESKEKVAKYESLDDWMDIKVYTYRNRVMRENFYMVKIFAKKGKHAFQVMPKEILFTVDASLSISKDRLEEIKEGIRYCLTHLNPNDTFNIVAFKDKTSFFKPQSVSATPDMIKEAQRFVMSLTSSQQTDVYAAFQGIVERPLGKRPSNVILISDGRPTFGVVDSRELINSVTRINAKVRPIFSFSGGAKVNRYLLDFISYQNRAWSQFVKETNDIDKGLAEFYDKIKDPLFLNLRYQLSGLEEEEVFPKSLPDFYKNAEFTLFGKYSDEDKFSMQLLGDVEGKTKELIFERSLSEAEKAGPEIMKGYAFNRIYYLINRVTEEGPRPELIKEIEVLSERYGITTPYSPELEKPN